MSEAEKKPTEPGRQNDDANRSGTVKPFPDFIVAPPGAPSGSGSGTAADTGAGAGGNTADSVRAAPARGGETGVPSGKDASANARTPAAAPPRRGGGGWAFLFALVSVAAAGVSLSAPSLRPLVSTELKGRFGDQRWIDILTGAADTRPPSVIQLDLQQFDKRLEALGTALTTANPGAPVDGATLARFADAAGATQRMADFETALQTLKTRESEQLAVVSQSIGRIDEHLSGIGQRTEALEGATGHLAEQVKTANTQADKLSDMAQTADTATKELATSLGGALQKLTANEAAIADLAGKVSAVSDSVAARVTQALEPLTARVAEAEHQAAAGLEGLRKDLGVVTTTLGEVNAQIKALDSAGALQDGRIDTLNQQSETLARSIGIAATTLAGVGDRLTAVEKKLEKPSVATASTLLGLTNRLHTAIDDGEPFVLEVATIRALAGDDAAFSGPLSTLAPLAQRGVPSLIILRREFNNTARRVIEAEEAAQPAWYQRQWANVTYYLGWSRSQVDGVTTVAESARPVLSQAAGSINNGQFAEAVAALSSLHGTGSELALPWIGAARARVAADEAVKGLARATMGRLTAR